MTRNAREARGRRRWSRRFAYLGVVACLLTVLLWAANVPFYSGWGRAHFGWRMEHGRIKVEWSDEPRLGRESFYIAGNSEGLRWWPKWRLYSWTDGYVNVPLWMILIGEIGMTSWLFVRSRRDPSGPDCPKCEYPLRGLENPATCPECGAALVKKSTKRKPPKDA